MSKLTFLGQSGWLVEGGGHSVVIDPFLTDNPVARHKAKDIKADFVVLSHAHGDHTADAEPIAKANSATIIANFEIANHYGAKDCKVHPMHLGGKHDFPFGSVKFTPAFHGSSFPDGKYGGMPGGILLTIGGKTIYHTGDTALFSDMGLIGKHARVDVMLVCIGDNFTMGIDDAVEAVDLVRPKLAIPMHYNTWDLIKADPTEFAQKANLQGYEVKVVDPGEDISI